MAEVPREFFTEAFVLSSGTGFDDYGTPTHGGTLVSGTGYLKETERYELTNAGTLAILDLERSLLSGCVVDPPGTAPA